MTRNRSEEALKRLLRRRAPRIANSLSVLRRRFSHRNTITDNHHNRVHTSTDLWGEEFSSELEYHRTLSSMGLNNPLSYLDNFLCSLQGLHRSVQIVPLGTFAESDESQSDKAQVAIRVDCCGTLSAGLANALIYTRRGVPAHFFINHSATYFKHIREDPKSGTSAAVQEIALLGHQIGLHNDVFSLSDIPSEQVRILKEDLTSLRDLGLQVISTASHNSAWSYGVENFRIFSDFGLASGTPEERLPRISLNELDLRWDASFPDGDFTGHYMVPDEYKYPDAIRHPDYQRHYFLNHPSLRRRLDMEAWLLATDAWVLVDYVSGTIDFPMTGSTVINSLASQPYGSRCMLLIHPEYCSHNVVSS